MKYRQVKNMDMNLASALVGGALGFVASMGALIAERLWDRAGSLKIFYVIRSSHRNAVDTFGTSDSSDGPTFVVPLVFELQNTTNTTRVMRDVSVLIYKDGKYVDEMIQIGQSGEKDKKHQEYGDNNQSYSFLVEAKSIKKIYGTYIYAPGSDPTKKQDFNEIRLRYFDEKNKSREYHIRYIDNPWDQRDINGDENWILLENNTCYKKQVDDVRAIADPVPLTSEKISYLEMVQEPISRMSTASAIFKGFAATIVAGIATLSYCQVNTWILVLSFIPIVLFAFLDIYYLKLEKKYRFLYEQIRNDIHSVDFSMKLTKDNKAARSRIWDCLLSPSVWLFYPVMLGILVVVLILRFKGVI